MNIYEVLTGLIWKLTGKLEQNLLHTISYYVE